MTDSITDSDRLKCRLHKMLHSDLTGQQNRNHTWVSYRTDSVVGIFMTSRNSKVISRRPRTEKKSRRLTKSEKRLIDLLENAPAFPLANSGEIRGQGVYALVYRGQFPTYAPISVANRVGARVYPIYLGKAWALKVGGEARAGAERVGRHRRSITVLRDLDVNDFEVRFIRLPWGKVESVEQALIKLYAPLWNAALPGFGNKQPGNTRETQRRSAFDTFHPGRAYTDALQPTDRSLSDLKDAVIKHILSWAECVVDRIAEESRNTSAKAPAAPRGIKPIPKFAGKTYGASVLR
ncbi:Eco29kI family restriction endonuclease [Rhizobium sp. Rhizsp82]|uniref:Eco29kI family restriction endonuclease n=1 Tax=Rhizobium sp. Rhizsp82 TaxID=3243057 RepID=UPI0039B5A37D